MTRVKINIEGKGNYRFGKATTDLARKLADGLLPIEDYVDWQEDKVDQILMGSGLEGDVSI